MSDANENSKDDLAVRALSRLPPPPLPDGLAARIKARATAAPQSNAAHGAAAMAVPSPPVTSTCVDVPMRRSPRRWPIYAAASIAALFVISIGVIVNQRDQKDMSPVMAKSAPARALPAVKQADRSEVAETVPDAAAPTSERRLARRSAEPRIGKPVQDTPSDEAPSELASEAISAEKAAAAPPRDEEQERLAQNRPQMVPEGGGTIARPVYGPPAPSGLGIAGPVGGSPSLPNENGSGTDTSRGTPPSAPPVGFPGPRGPGPRF